MSLPPPSHTSSATFSTEATLPARHGRSPARLRISSAGADGIGCQLLSRRGVSGEAMIRMLAKLAAATRDRDGALAVRIAAAREACTPVPGPR